MHPNTLKNRKICLFAAASAAVYATAMIGLMLFFLQDAAAAAVPFGGHTLAIGHDYVWANRIAVLFIVVSCALLAHALARIVQITGTWRQPSKTS
jgi:hypothetical protein